MAFSLTCELCLAEVLVADLIDDEEECALRDHLLALHPRALQPSTLLELLRHFAITPTPPPAA